MSPLDRAIDSQAQAWLIKLIQRKLEAENGTRLLDPVEQAEEDIRQDQRCNF